MKRWLVAVSCAVLVSGCGGSDVDLNNPDDLESYYDGFIWLETWGGDRECSGDVVDDWKDLTKGATYELNEDAFLLGCNDYLDGKIPRK